MTAFSIFLRALVLAIGLLGWGWCASEDGTTSEEQRDEALLRQEQVGTDSASLLAFFRKRTLTPEDVQTIRKFILQLGDEDFETRETATRELVLRGPIIRAMLREHMLDPDPEVARRIRICMEKIEQESGSAVPLAAARLLGKQNPPEATGALLAFLPFNEDELVEEGVVEVLVKMTPPGKSPPELLRGLKSSSPIVRAACAHVVAWQGGEKDRQRVYPLLEDPNPKVRWKAGEGLVSGGEKRGVTVLIDLAAEAPADLAWRAEEMLYRLAGEEAAGIVASTGTSEERSRAREAWLAWWKANESRIDLARIHTGPRQMGLTLGIEYNTGRVWEMTLDGKVRWEITGLAGPMEAQVLPNGRVLVAESNSHRVTERDTRGNVLWEIKISGEPTGCQRLPTGNTFVSTYSSAMEFDRAGKKLYEHRLTQGSNAIWMHRNGHILYAANDALIEMDKQARQVRSIRLPSHNWTGVQDLQGDRFLLASSSSGKIVEVDRGGTVLWEHSLSGSCGIARLSNGNTLVGTNRRVVEVDRQGREVWKADRPGYVRRVHRR